MTAPSVVMSQVSLPGLPVVMVATAMYGCGASNAISIVPASPFPSSGISFTWVVRPSLYG
jgi:hypothetical protein